MSEPVHRAANSSAGSPASLRVAAVQMNGAPDLAHNLAECRRLVLEASRRGAQLVLLPENFAFMGPPEERAALAENFSGDKGDSGAVFRALGEMAREHGIFLVGGGTPEVSAEASRPYNTAVVVGPSGDVVACYRKLHLFDVDLGEGVRFTESASTSCGDGPLVVEIAGFQVGLSICYDLRFPELYRALADRGAEVVLVPAAFTSYTGKDHWHVLLRARAIENQAWVVAAAQWGRHPDGRQTYGHSLVVDPWGTVVAECSDGVGVICADLDRALIDRVRRELPSLRHRRT